MWGVLLAVAVRSETFPSSNLVRAARVSFVGAGLLALAAATYHVGWIVYSLSAFASISLVYLSLFDPNRWLQWLLTNRFMVYTGTISYGLYLLHKIPFDVAKLFPLDRYAVVVMPLMLAVCYGIATLSWVLLEKPFIRMKRAFESRPAHAKGVPPPLSVLTTLS